MFSNLDWTNIMVILVVALFIFGDKLPQLITDGLRLLRNLRRMAQNATTDLSRELGTDIQLEDLHPKTFVRKHLLSEADQQKLLQPLKGVSEDVVRQTRGLQDDLKQVGKGAEGVAGDLKRAADGRGKAATGRRQAVGRTDRTKTAAGAGPATGEVGAGADGAGVVDPTTAEAAPAPRRGYDDIT